MISIVTGTLDRIELLKKVIENTVEKSDKLELVLVDGGSTDGTIEYIKSLNNPQIKLIEVGERSSYPHFMNLGVRNAKYDWIAQWNDDILLINEWDDVFQLLEDGNEAYIFDWTRGDLQNYENKTFNERWIYFYDCMNFGIYSKNIFKEIGLYDNAFKYYECDHDMATRCVFLKRKIVNAHNIKVLEINTEKRCFPESNDRRLWEQNRSMYMKGEIPERIEKILKKVISFSIYGDSKKYTVGLLRNLEIFETIYSGWEVYVYYNSTVPNEMIEQYKTFKNVNLIDMSDSSIPGMFWRFTPYENIELFISRDADSRLSMREKLAVDEWLESDKILHIMRDHPHHEHEVNGGMFGLKITKDFNLIDEIKTWLIGKNLKMDNKFGDLDFLRETLFKKYKDGNVIAHDSVWKDRVASKPFPTPMENYRFVGEIFDENENRYPQYMVWKNITELR